jgi:hypothetical protein
VLLYAAARTAVLRGQLSLAESVLPPLFVLMTKEDLCVKLAPKFNKDTFKEFKDGKGRDPSTWAKKKVYKVLYLCVLCQLTGKVHHKPIESTFPG